MADRYDNLEILSIPSLTGNPISTYESFPHLTQDEVLGDNPIFHKVTANDRFDLLSAKYYHGDPTKWWIILLANGKALPTDLRVGEMIKIPQHPERIDAIIRRKSSENNDTD